MWFRSSLLGLISLFTATAFAQWIGNRSLGSASHPEGREGGIVRGQVTSDYPLAGSLSVELRSSGHVGVISSFLEPNGAFEFHGVTPGQYQLRLTGAAGAVIHEEMIFISGEYQNLSIHMPDKQQVGRSGDATVSIRQLQHKVPTEARREFSKGQAASTKGDQSNALDHFQKATKLDPEFADAFNGIGVTYATLGKLEQASDHFKKAIELVPDFREAEANLSIVLCKLKQYREADEMARRALRLDPGLLKLRYVLGISLVNDGGDTAEAIDNLQRAAAEIPGAHLLAAKLLADDNRRQEAVKHLEEYLRLSPTSDHERPKIEEWLVLLRQ